MNAPVLPRDDPGVHAVTIDDGTLDWREHPDPEPGTGELLVAVRTAGLNAGDLLQLAGHYPAPPGSPPDIPGLELAGEVVALGPGVTRFSVGDRVMAVVGGGGQAELAVVHERCALRVPDALDWDAAGGFPEAFTTAHDAVFTQAELGVGESLLVHGAAGGVGVAAVQLGVAAGARVVGTVRDPALRERVNALGATAIEPEGFGEHGPFDVILELIGGPNLRDDVRALAVGGRISIIGVGAGPKAEISLLDLMNVRGRIHGSTLRARPLEQKAAAAAAVARHVLPLVDRGRVTVPIEATFPMSQATAAYEHFRAGGKFGKVVLSVG
jgi:NADPH2:quinone reductase